ncbi:MAG: CBS domain-containing protein [Deltaproteobacteria bacterium]|nr:CBS domain-containing protein [Deltaproteobacteria bacterium]
MQVQNWMTSDVITVNEDTPVIKISKILEENDISHLPVIAEGKLAGIITDHEVQEAVPSKSTTLSAHELHHLLAETKARDIMKQNPITIEPEETMEIAAVEMLKHKIGSLPVVGGKGELLGIITKMDVFRVLISITGIYQGGVQFAFKLEDKPGSIKEACDVIRKWGGRIISILSTRDKAEEGYRHTFIRTKGVPDENLPGLKRDLEKEFRLLYMKKDPIREK